jgi:hypothetical protein
MAIDKKLLEILACPKCKGDVKISDDGKGIICEKCRLIYPVRDDIPVMLIDEAKSIGS